MQMVEVCQMVGNAVRGMTVQGVALRRNMSGLPGGSLPPSWRRQPGGSRRCGAHPSGALIVVSRNLISEERWPIH